MLGALSMLGGVGLDMWPTVRERGRHAFLPGFVLAEMTPPVGEDAGAWNNATHRWEIPGVTSELKRRIMTDDLSPSNMLTAIRKSGALSFPRCLESGTPLVVGMRFPLAWTGFGVVELLPRTPGLGTIRAGQMIPVCGFSREIREKGDSHQVLGVPPDATTAIEFDVRVTLRRNSRTPSRWGTRQDVWNYEDTIKLGVWRVPIKMVY